MNNIFLFPRKIPRNSSRSRTRARWRTMVMVITENSVGNPFVKIIKIQFKEIPMRAGRGDPRMRKHLVDKWEQSGSGVAQFSFTSARNSNCQSRLHSRRK